MFVFQCVYNFFQKIESKKQMITSQVTEQFYFFPIQFRKNSKVLKINSQSPHTQLLVTANKAYIDKENKNIQIRIQNNYPFKLKIVEGFLLIQNSRKQQIIEIIEANFDMKFQIIQQKVNNSLSIDQKSSQISKSTYQKILIFTFKSFNLVRIQFNINPNQKQSLSRFKQSLSKIAIDNSNFHKRFKPIQKISYGQNFSLIRSKDLMMSREIMVNAYRKQCTKSSIWKDLQFLGKIQWSKSCHLLQVMGFYESSNSIYIIFQKFDYFLQNYSRRLNQKFSSIFSSQYQKKIIHALEIILQIIKSLKYLHSVQISMNGVFNQVNLVFQQANGVIIPKLNPSFNHILKDNYLNHRKQLKNKIEFLSVQHSDDVFPSELFQINSWQYLDEVNYINFVKKCDIFGLGNLLHTLIFNQSVYGKQDNEEIRLNKNKRKVFLAPQIQEIKLICPQIVGIIEQMIDEDLNTRINLVDLEDKIGQTLKNLISKPKTSFQLSFLEQKQFFKQNQKISKSSNQNNKCLFGQAENKITNSYKNSSQQQIKKLNTEKMENQQQNPNP